MKTAIALSIVLISGSFATDALARGPAGCRTQMATQSPSARPYGAADCPGRNAQARNRMRNPASNPTGRPIRARARMHQATPLPPPATAPAN